MDSLNRVPAASGAVFMSYASQDTEPAKRIYDALRAGGIEVWFDQSELRGGDAWDQKIRREIHDCAIFMPLISQTTQKRLEGYFRHEWRLAIERTHHMGEQMTFLVPVVIDRTGNREAVVPDAFRAVQWTQLPGGETPVAFVERVQRLLSPEPSTARRPPSTPATERVSTTAKDSQASGRAVWIGVALVVIGLTGFLAYEHSWTAPRSVSAPAPPEVPRSADEAVFHPPPHSVAVLPFVNLSGDPKQEYFSDGLTEELLNSLAAIEGLQVAARTSSFYFKGKDTDLGSAAHKLNVASILEGSGRRSAHTVRVTAQLVNAQTGFQLWSKTYDRDLGDVLKLQTEIATSVAEALKVTLLGDVAEKIELGGTHNPAAFDAYLKGRKALQRDEAQSIQDAITALTEAIRLDSHYALALAARSTAYIGFAADFATGAATKENYDKGIEDARQALAIAPELGDGYLALAVYFESTLDFARASEAYERARALSPGNAELLRRSGRFAVFMGQTEPGLTALRRAVVLDPLGPEIHRTLSQGLLWGRRYREAVAAAKDALSLDADDDGTHGVLGLAYYALGNFDQARIACETKNDSWGDMQCLAVTYEKLGRPTEARSMLAKFEASLGDSAAYQYATIYAQWGDTPKALEWLDTAVRLRDAGLDYLKTDPLMDPLRQEPRFQKVLRDLKFPD